jgi:hypothetical protein
MSRICGLFLLCSFAVAVFGQTSDPPKAALPTDQSTRAAEVSAGDLSAVEKFLLNGIVSDFKKAAAKTGHDFDDQRQPKAAAVCIAWPHGNDDSKPALLYWGDEWTDSDKDTPQSIRQEAFHQCELSKKEGEETSEWTKLGIRNLCECQFLLEDSTPVLAVPEEATRIIATKLSQEKVPTLCSNWFGGNDFVVDPFGSSNRGENDWPLCEGYPEETVKGIKFTVDDLALFKEKEAKNIYPPAPVVRATDIKALRITDPSWGSLISGYLVFHPPTRYSSLGPRYVASSFELPSGWGYHIGMHRVPQSAIQSVRDKISPFEHSKLLPVERQDDESATATATLTQQDSSQSTAPPDRLAMYIRTYDLTDPEVAKEVDFPAFPENRINVVYGERSLKLWAECFIPVDDNGVPVGQPLRLVIPLALETTTSMYLFTVQVVYTGRQGSGRGGTIAGFEGKVFDLSGCANAANCFAEVRRAFIAELTADFGLPPLSAIPVRKNMPPYQARFHRVFDESNVLKGLSGPYYELTTYTITLWPGPSGDFTGSNEGYMNGEKGNGRPADQVFLQISQDLQIAVGRKGDYNEPSPQQYAAYQQAVDAVVKRAIAHTASALGGTTEGGVGIVKSASAPKR